MCSGTSFLELNLFWKTVWEAICLKLNLLCGETHYWPYKISRKGLWSREWRSKVLLDNCDIFFVNNLVENRNVLRNKMCKNWGLAFTLNIMLKIIFPKNIKGIVLLCLNFQCYSWKLWCHSKSWVLCVSCFPSVEHLGSLFILSVVLWNSTIMSII